MVKVCVVCEWIELSRNIMFVGLIVWETSMNRMWCAIQFGHRFREIMNCYTVADADESWRDYRFSHTGKGREWLWPRSILIESLAIQRHQLGHDQHFVEQWLKWKLLTTRNVVKFCDHSTAEKINVQKNVAFSATRRFTVTDGTVHEYIVHPTQIPAAQQANHCIRT